MKLPVYSDGTARELVYPGALMTRKQALRYGQKNMPNDLRKTAFVTHVFQSDPIIHGAHYFRITYGKNCL